MIDYKLLDNLMAIKNITKSELCKKTGIANATFVDWEKGKYSPKIEKLEILANFFGVPITYFFDGNAREKDDSYSLQDIILARELNKSDKIELIKDIMKIQSEKDLQIIDLLTKKFLNKDV